MDIKTDEIQDNIFRICIRVPNSPVSFNHFVIRDEKPTIIHTGHLETFQLLYDAVRKLLDPSSMRFLVFSHYEPDECGNLNKWLNTAPLAQACINKICDWSIRDFAIRPSHIVKDKTVLDLGNHKLIVLETPHFPHAWEATMFYETQTGTLFSSDIGTQVASSKKSSSPELVEEIVNVQMKLEYTAFGPAMDAGLKKLSKLDVRTMAVMHGLPLDKQTSLTLLEYLDEKNREICTKFLEVHTHTETSFSQINRIHLAYLMPNREK